MSKYDDGQMHQAVKTWTAKEIQDMVEKIILDEKDIIKKMYDNSSKAAINYVIGKVMFITKGSANPNTIPINQEVIENLFGKGQTSAEG